MEMEWKPSFKVTVLTAQELVDQDGKRKVNKHPCDALMAGCLRHLQEVKPCFPHQQTAGLHSIEAPQHQFGECRKHLIEDCLTVPFDVN